MHDLAVVAKVAVDYSLKRIAHHVKTNFISDPESLPVLSVEVTEVTTSSIDIVWGPLGTDDFPAATAYSATIRTESDAVIQVNSQRGL